MWCGGPDITGRGDFDVLNVKAEKCLRSHASSLSTFSSRGGNGMESGLVRVKSPGGCRGSRVGAAMYVDVDVATVGCGKPCRRPRPLHAENER